MNALYIFYGAIIGAILGSFLNAAIPRRHELKTLLTTRSYCPVCRTQIKGYDNIPILSWFLLGGKCRACKAPIPVFYTYLEVSLAAVGALVADLLVGPTALALVVILAIWAVLIAGARLVSQRALRSQPE